MASVGGSRRRYGGDDGGVQRSRADCRVGAGGSMGPRADGGARSSDVARTSVVSGAEPNDGGDSTEFLGSDAEPRRAFLGGRAHLDDVAGGDSGARGPRAGAEGGDAGRQTDAAARLLHNRDARDDWRDSLARHDGRPPAVQVLTAWYHFGFLPRTSPSSRGPGRGPFKAKTRVRIPLGTPQKLQHRPTRQASARSQLPLRTDTFCALA